MKTSITFFLSFLLAYTGHSQTIDKFSIDSGGGTASAGNIQILYTIGEVNVQELSAGNIQISEGFINPNSLMIRLDPRIFLQGPYNAGLMNDNLRSNNVIPTTSPYADAATCNASVFNTTGNNAIIDWVWIEVRASSDQTTVIAQTSALLRANGKVVATDGVSAVPVNVQSGSYYIMIGHRNHLGILTSNAVNLNGGTKVLDLSTNSELVMGGTNGIGNMGSGRFALYSGDFDGNGQVQNADATGVMPFLGLSGYYNADINMNGQVQNGDIIISIYPNIGKGQQFANRNLFAKRRPVSNTEH